MIVVYSARILVVAWISYVDELLEHACRSDSLEKVLLVIFASRYGHN